MHVFKVLYYHYFLYYKNVLNDPDPHFSTIISLSMGEGILVNGIIDILVLNLFCDRLPVWVQIVIALSIVAGNLILFPSNKASAVSKQKPQLANSRALSILVSWLFFLLTSSWLFWGGIYAKHVIEHCK